MRITGSIRHDGRVYGAGDEESFAPHLTPDEARRLTELGVIEGDWSHPEVLSGAADFLDGMVPEWGERIVDSLRSGGYDTREAIESATDTELIALPVIGEASVRRIRKTLAG